MKTRFLLCFLLCSFFAQAQTIEVSGVQTGTWVADTVLVTGDVLVQDSLSIAPGTTVLFKGFYSLTAEKGASLKAMGTETDSITFTVMDTTGFHIFNSGRGGWNGIQIDQAGTVQLDYCRLQYGKAALDADQDGGALCIYNSNDVKISNSTLFCNFSREHGGALNAEHSTVVVHNCAVSHNLAYTEIDTVYFMYGGAFRFINCAVSLTDVDFLHNLASHSIGGALSLDSCAVSIDRCRFEHNVGINGGGLYLIRSNDWPCSITNSLFANNRSEHFGGGLAISDASPELSNLTVVDNHSYGVMCGGIFFYQHSSPLVRNCIVWGNTNGGPVDLPVQIWSWTYDDYAPRFHNCLVQYGFKNITNNEIISVYEDCLDEDPLFVDNDNEDYHLSISSGCINSGYTRLPDLSTLDLDLSPRVKGGIVDMGAYEFSGTDIPEQHQQTHFVHLVGNPITAASYADIEMERTGLLRIDLYSIEGRQLYHSQRHVQAGSHREELGSLFQSLPQGSYLLVFSMDGNTLMEKVIK